MQFRVQNWWKEPKTMAMNQQSIQAKNSVKVERKLFIVIAVKNPTCTFRIMNNKIHKVEWLKQE